MAVSVVDPSKRLWAEAARKGAVVTMDQSMSLEVVGATKAAVAVRKVAFEGLSGVVGTVVILTTIVAVTRIVRGIGVRENVGAGFQARLATVVRVLVAVVLLIARDVVDIRVIVTLVVIGVMADEWSGWCCPSTVINDGAHVVNGRAGGGDGGGVTA